MNRVGWAEGAILRRYLSDALVYQSTSGGLYIESKLATQLKLRKKYPDLLLYPMKMLDDPLDGDTLPGDPGWDGTFRERPTPRAPKGRPHKTRWTY